MTQHTPMRRKCCLCSPGLSTQLSTEFPRCATRFFPKVTDFLSPLSRSAQRWNYPPVVSSCSGSCCVCVRGIGCWCVGTSRLQEHVSKSQGSGVRTKANLHPPFIFEKNQNIRESLFVNHTHNTARNVQHTAGGSGNQTP